MANFYGLLQLHITEIQKGLKLVFKILSNVMKEPTNKKFHDISFKRITKIIGPSMIWKNILKDSGFNKQSKNSSIRLVFSITNLPQLKTIYDQVHAYHQLIVSNGYGINETFYVLNKCNGSMSNAIQFIKEWKCNGYIKSCPHFIRLKDVLNNNYMIEDNINIVATLNNFHHLLFKHITDFEFEYIYKEIKTCDISTCEMIKRNRMRLTATNNQHNLRYFSTRNILDKIHCHYSHCYDIGHRLTSKEKQINNTDINAGKRKTILHQNIIQKQQIHNKFNQMGTQHANMKRFDFGFRYFYWKAFQTSNLIFYERNGGDWFTTWYITPKYATFKEELTNNSIYPIKPIDWSILLDQVVSTLQTEKCKKMKANPRPSNNLLYDSVCYGILKGAAITPQHLISIIVYCSYTDLSYKFSETFRLLPSESFANLRSRHSNFYHLSKLIHESIYCYSEAIHSRNNSIPVYHGISEDMYFDSTVCWMHQPLSTTLSYEVAKIFSNNIGMIVEIKANPYQRYFDCCWLSRFSNESELLFIGCTYRLTFVNITSIKNGVDNRIDVECISMFDQMFCANLYQNDNGYEFNKHLKKLNNQQQQPQNRYPPVTTKPISSYHQLRLRKLIKNQIKSSNKNSYITNLFNHICKNKKIVWINWQAMQSTTSNQIQRYSNGGYCGYSFLKDMFCEKNCEMVNLNEIEKICPNIHCIGLVGINQISSKSLGLLWNYLSSSSSKMKLVRFEFKLSNFQTTLMKYQKWISEFKVLGYGLEFKKNTLVIGNSDMTYLSPSQ